VINKFNLLPVLCALCSVHFGVDAAVRYTNTGSASSSRNYADAYNQVAIMQQIAYQNDPANVSIEDIESLPVRVADHNIARTIITSGAHASANLESLQNCSMIYLNGSFAWDKPNAGMRQKSEAGCVAEVEMRKIRVESDFSKSFKFIFYLFSVI